MASKPAPPLTVRLATGETVRVNDHVYCETPFVGHAWAVGRIMEILAPARPDLGVPSSSAAAGRELEMRVKLAVYLRPDEVTGRRSKDDRLLYTAFKSFIHPVSNLRGRCYVKHKSHIDDLAAWKKEPNHFFFERLYDEYLKREYEVVGVSAFRNLPDELRTILASRYSFLVCEKEAFAEYSVERQNCRICSKWASPPQAVRCSICAESFHMHCCTPRVTTKPIRGYSWTCAPCYRQHERDVDAHRAPAKPKLERSLKAAEHLSKVPSTDKVLRTFRGWPMRYLGQFNLAEDAIDPDDGIFPRSASRVGSRFQATWLPAVGDQTRGPDVFERGGDATVELRSRPTKTLDTLRETLQARNVKLPPPCKMSNVGVLDRLAHLGLNLPLEDAVKAFQASTAKQFDLITCTPDQLKALVKSLNEHHGLDAHEAALATGRSPAHTVRLYREWKDDRLREFFSRTATAAMTGTVSDALVEPTLFPAENLLAEKDLVYSPEGGKDPSCSACGRRKSRRWWTMIQEDYDGVYCDGCRDFFQRYAQIPKKPPADKLVLKMDKQRAEENGAIGPPSKKQKLNGRAASPKSSKSASMLPHPPPPPPLPTPPPPVSRPPPKPLPCACCRVHDLKRPVARCANCSFSVHPACYGIPPPAEGAAPSTAAAAEWKCEVCANVDTEQYRKVARCVLCPNSWKGKGPPPAVPHQTQLYALKPTLDGNWAHLYCSVFQPEVTLTNPEEMKHAEGIHRINADAWTTPCSICHRVNHGAVVPCADCFDVFHVSCAYKAGYTFGIEISLAKSSNKDTRVVKFQEERGRMHSKIVCKQHDLEGRLIYPLHERDDALGKTALEVFVETYKAPAAGSTAVPLLRKAETLQRALADAKPPAAPAAPPPEPACATCQIGFSPRWYPLPNAAGAVECHQCSHKRTAPIS